MVFYCESCRDFLGSCGMEDDVFYDALILMFGQALKAIAKLEPDQSGMPLLTGLNGSDTKRGTGDGASERAMDDLMEEYGPA